jgi:hypothetical protein
VALPGRDVPPLSAQRSILRAGSRENGHG